VAHEQRRRGRIQRLEKSFAVHVRKIDDHAQTIRFFNNFHAEVR
jgi:hypothetical protein